MNGSFIWHKNFGRTVFRFITIHAFDNQTDGNLVANTALSALHSMQQGENFSTTLCM